MALLRQHQVIDPWFPVRYSLDLYAHCPAKCLYCPASWQGDTGPFAPREDILTQLEQEIAKLHEEATKYKPFPPETQIIGLGAGLHDPLLPPDLHGGGGRIATQATMAEAVIGQLARAGVRTYILTKAPGELLKIIDSQVGKELYARKVLPVVVTSIPLTTNEEEAAILEGQSPSLSKRLQALGELHKRGLPVGMMLLSLSPWDREGEMERLAALLPTLSQLGVNFVMLQFLATSSLSRVCTRLLEQVRKVPELCRFAEGLRFAKDMAGEGMEKRNVFAQSKNAFERSFKEQLRKFTLPYMPPALLYREALAPQDAISVTFAQMYYLSRDLGRRRDFFKLAAFHLSTMKPSDFSEALSKKNFSKWPGIGDYSENLILKMALRHNYRDFDRIFMEWYQT